jgi:hypothetical protein
LNLSTSKPGQGWQREGEEKFSVKKILILCASILVIGALYVIFLYSRPEHYGKAFGGAQVVSIAQVVEKHMEGEIHVEGKIVRQCPVSGCWFYLSDGKGHQFRAEFGNTLPVLPKKIGHTAIVEGRLIKVSEEPTLAGVAVEFK